MYQFDNFATETKIITDRLKIVFEFPRFMARAENIGKLYRRAPAHIHEAMKWESGLIVNALINQYGYDIDDEVELLDLRLIVN